jgi:hypothetical protein
MVEGRRKECELRIYDHGSTSEIGTSPDRAWSI